MFSNGHECICRDADGDALESLPNSGKEFPPCSYIGGDEDPSKCNSSRCPRHSKMGIHTCDRCPAERPIGRMRCMACEAKIGKHNIDTHGIDCGCPACSAQTAAMRRQSTQDGGDDPVLAERERCARIVEVLAHFMETGAGPLNAPGARLRQAARGIRDGEPSVLWDESHREDKKYELPVPSCGHGAQAWCIACHECGDMPDERRIIASAKKSEGT